LTREKKGDMRLKKARARVDEADLRAREADLLAEESHLLADHGPMSFGDGPSERWRPVYLGQPFVLTRKIPNYMPRTEAALMAWIDGYVAAEG